MVHESNRTTQRPVLSVRSSVWLILAMCVWLYFGPPLFALMWGAADRESAVAVAVFGASLLMFWSFAIYGLTNSVIAAAGKLTHAKDLRVRLPTICPTGASTESAGVALLYPTRNDVRGDAVEALRRVRSPAGWRCEVVICDDSTLGEWRQRVSELSSGSQTGLNPVRVIRRRAGSPGWKAGNLNSALRILDKEGFQYFAVCDSDGVFPDDFLEKSLPLVTSSEEMRISKEPAAQAFNARSSDPGLPIARVALVQTRQEGDATAVTRFSRTLASAVGAHFRHQVAGRAKDGFVMFYGHGALISMDAWREVGGLPEIVTEDLAFSMRLRMAGWRAVYADQVVCQEEFPLSWHQLRKRTDKWIRGTAECLMLHGWNFFRARCVPFREKLDVWMHGTQHFLALPMLIFLILLATVLPWKMKEFRLPGSFFRPPVMQGKNLIEAAMGLRYHVFWSWDFFAMMVVSMLAPILPMVAESLVAGKTREKSEVEEKIDAPQVNRPQRSFAAKQVVNAGRFALLRFFMASTFAHLAGLVAESLAVLAFAISGKATFRATNDAAEGNSARGTTRGRPRISNFHPNHPLVFGLEIVVGVGFLAAVWVHRNLWFLGPGTALLLSPVVARLGWERWWVTLADRNTGSEHDGLDSANRVATRKMAMKRF